MSVSDRPFRAIVAYNISAAGDERPSEDWRYYLQEVRRAASSHGIIFLLARPPYEEVKITGKRKELLAWLDISGYVKQARVGFIFIRPDKAPVFAAHNLAYDALERAGEYFGMNLE